MFTLRSLWLLALVLTVSVVAAARPAQAIWVAVPLEILVDEAVVIVEGKVAKIEAAGFALNNRPQDAAVVEVSAVLKALPGAGQPKQVRIAQPAAAAGGLAVSTDLRYPVGQQGIWLLTKDPQRDIYLASHPSQFQNASEKETLVQLIAARAKLPGGEAVQGLVARAEVIATTPANSPAFFEVRVSLKNVSDKPITICDFVGHRPLQVEWTGPTGPEMSTHYDWLKAVRLRAPAAENFPTIPPGGVLFLGPRSNRDGVYFRSAGGPPRPDVNTAAAGNHTVIVAYANSDNGERVMVKDVWTGRVVANAVAFATQ